MFIEKSRIINMGTENVPIILEPNLQQEQSMIDG